MFPALNRLLSFFGRKKRSSPSSSRRENQQETVSPPQQQQHEPADMAALTRQEDDKSAAHDLSCCSDASWSTVGSKVGARGGGSGRRAVPSTSGVSHRLLSATIPRIWLRQKDEFVVLADISNGWERYKIPALSYQRNDSPPSNFYYVTEYVLSRPLQSPADIAVSSMSPCKCTTGDCSNGQCGCSSSAADGSRAPRYNSKGRLSSSYNIEAPEPIYECTTACGCNRKTCQNMVIQAGSRCKVALIRTRSRGWGVKTLEPLKRGTFVGVYSGELILADESRDRKDDTYLFNLTSTHIYYDQQQEAPVESADENQQAHALSSSSSSLSTSQAEANLAGCERQGEEGAALCPEVAPTAAKVEQQNPAQVSTSREQFICDAKFYGNFTRFINHSCNPNVVGIRSFTVHRDVRFPYIAFFTNQNIPAQTELSLHYGDNYWLVKGKRDKVFCRCKQTKCQFNERVFPETLRRYNERINH